MHFHIFIVLSNHTVLIYLRHHTDCDEPSGLVAETVHSNQITANSAYDDAHAPRHGRLETIGRFRPGWVPSSVDKRPWIEVDLLEVFRLRHILTQGCQTDDFWTTLYKLQYWDSELKDMVYCGDDGTREKVKKGIPVAHYCTIVRFNLSNAI